MSVDLAHQVAGSPGLAIGAFPAPRFVSLFIGCTIHFL
jgi:hypothetical protein